MSAGSVITLPQLESFVFRCLSAAGMGQAPATSTAEALAATDAMGVFTHGSKLLAGYLKRLQGGG